MRFINQPLLETYGICHPGGGGTSGSGIGARRTGPEIVHALLRAGYDSDLNVEGCGTTRFTGTTILPGRRRQRVPKSWRKRG